MRAILISAAFALAAFAAAPTAGASCHFCAADPVLEYLRPLLS
jgi:hypothetical protein